MKIKSIDKKLQEQQAHDKVKYRSQVEPQVEFVENSTRHL